MKGLCGACGHRFKKKNFFFAPHSSHRGGICGGDKAMAACAAGAAQTGLQIPRRPPAGRRGCSLRCPLWGERLRRALPEAASPAAAVLNAKRQAGPLVAGRRAALSVTCASRFKTLVDFLLGGPAESREREEAVSRQYRRTVFDFPARPRLCRARPLFFLSRSQ